MSFGRPPAGSRWDVDWAVGGLCRRNSRLSRDDPAVPMVARGMGNGATASGSGWEAGVAPSAILDHYDLAPRDSFIGWTQQLREKNFPLVVDNPWLLVLPWIAIPIPGSHILAIIRLRVHQGLDMIGDALSGLAQLSDNPVGGVPFGDDVGTRVVDQPLGQ